MSERDLAEHLQVSRPSVREAIRSLEMMGFIEIRRGDGTFIRNTDADEIIRPLAMFLAVEKSSLLDMFEIRRLFETATARMAAERATAEEVDRLRVAWEAMKERLNARIGSAAKSTTSTSTMRLRKLAQCTVDQAVSHNIGGIYPIGGGGTKTTVLGYIEPQKLVEQHRRIYSAIKEHEPNAAAAPCRHLSYAERELRKGLRQRNSLPRQSPVRASLGRAT